MHRWTSAASGWRLAVPTAAMLTTDWPWRRWHSRGECSDRPGGAAFHDAAAASTGPNILIVGIDGVDAESLSAYGYARDTSPYLAQLRDESLFFENAFSNVGRTHGSLVTLLTGRLPFSTHVTFPPTALEGDDAYRHLPGLLKRKGYTSLQLGMRHYADAEDANLLGFDAANYRWQDLDHIKRTSGGDEADVFRRAVAERLDERVGHLFGLRHAITSTPRSRGGRSRRLERRASGRHIDDTCRPRRSPGSFTRTSWTRTAARTTRRQSCSRDPIVRAMRSTASCARPTTTCGRSSSRCARRDDWIGRSWW